MVVTTMKVYMMVTKDKYSLPIAVAGSGSELSRITGVPEMQILSCVSKYRKGKIKNTRFICVEVEDDEGVQK